MRELGGVDPEKLSVVAVVVVNVGHVMDYARNVAKTFGGESFCAKFVYFVTKCFTFFSLMVVIFSV